MVFKKRLILFVLLWLTGYLTAADRIAVIQYPLTTRPAIVEQGGSFAIACKAVSNASSWAAQLTSPFKNVNLSVNASYNNSIGLWEISATVPGNTPAELYGLKITANGIEDRSVHAVRVIPEYKDSYYFIHVPDMHLPSVYWIGAYDDGNTIPELLRVFEQIALINPEFVLQTGDFVDNGRMEPQYQQAQQLLYTAQVPMFLTGGNHDLWYDGHTYWQRYFSPVMDYSFNYGDHHYTGMEMYDTPTVTFTADQMNWLQNDLVESITRQDALRTLFYHYDQSGQIDDDFIDEFDLDLIVYGHTHVDHEYSAGTRGIPVLNTSYTMDDRGAFRLVKVSEDQIQSWPLLSMNDLNVDYSPANDGSNWKVTAKITNNHNVDFENGLVKFYVQHNSAGYSATGGEIAQVISTNETDIYYVNVNIQANSEQTVDIISNAPPANRPPQISSYSPPTDASAMAGQQLPFQLNAADPENDNLTFTWYIDDQQVTGSSAIFNYTPEKWFTGMVEIKGRVSDGNYYDEHTWLVEVREYSNKPGLLFPSMSFILYDEETVLEWEEAFDHPLDVSFEYGLEPGVYTGSIAEMAGNTVAFTPELEGMDLGVHYCRLADGQVSSDPFTLIIESPVAPQMQHPIGKVPDLSPVFSWDRVPGVPYYVVICSDEEIIIQEDETTGDITVEGANPIWSLITSETSVPYGLPDPSGTYTSAPAPLIPGKSYWWIVLNCYGNVPELTSSVQSGISKFTVDLDPPNIAAPQLSYPDDGVILDDDLITFSWQPVDGASSYHFYPFKIEEEFGIESARGVWQSTITTTETQYEYAASELLMKGRYRWKVAAVAENGMEVLSDARDFEYDAPSAELSIYTKYYQQQDGATVSKPLPRVTIKYETIDGIYSDMPLSTDLDGVRLNYQIAPGTYRLTLSKEGYDTLVDTLVFAADQHYNKTYHLSTSSSAINGKVVDDGGNAVNDATVKAQHSLHAEIVKTTFTDAQGHFRLSVTPGPYQIWANKADYQMSDTLTLSVSSGEEGDIEQDLVLKVNTNRISGKVVNTQQQPVFGVTVTLTNGHELSCITNADGQFEFNVADGEWQLNAQKQGFIAPEPRYITTSGGGSYTISPALVLQSNAGIIQGRVTDGIRQLNDARVRAFPITGDPYETLTDDYGQFTLNVTGGTYTIKVDKEGYISDGDVQISVQGGSTQSGLEIAMAPSQSMIKGKVTIDGYTPLSDVMISNSSKNTLTTEGGQFELEIRSGTHVITALKEGYISSSPDTVTVLNGQIVERINFVLSPNASVIKGQITSGGSPVYQAQVNATGDFSVSATSDEEGRYVLNVQAGTWDLSISKSGFAAINENSLNIGTGQTLANKDFQLVSNSATITGNVISSYNGAALKNALVSIAGGDIATNTSTDGGYTLSVDPGNYEMHVEKQGYRTVTKAGVNVAANDVKQITFELEPVESSFTGSLKDPNAGPLEAVLISAQSQKETFTALSKSDGTFRLDINSGTYQITAEKAGYKPVDWGSVTIQANTSQQLAAKTMQPDRGTLTGMVHRVTNDAPVPSAKIIAKGQTGFTLQTQSNTDGAFVFKDEQGVPTLVPDTYRVVVSKAGFTPDTLQNIVLQSDQTKQVEAHILKNEGVIIGRTVSGSGPVADATINARSVATDQVYNAVSKQDGTFEIKSIPVGDYTLKAARVGYSSPAPMSVTTGSSSFDIALVKNTGKISGLVTDVETQAPIAAVQVSAADNQGNFSSAETNDQGMFALEGLPQSSSFTLELAKSGYAAKNFGPVAASGGKSAAIAMQKLYGQISGTVKDESGQPMANVIVTALGRKLAVKDTTTNNGAYQFSRLNAEQYTVSVFSVGYAGDPVQQIVALWDGGSTTGVDFTMQDARAAEIKIIGPEQVSNASQGDYDFAAKTSDQREASIQPVWSVETMTALDDLDQEGIVDPVDDYVGQLVLKLTDQYTGLSASKTLSITQNLVPKNPDLVLSNQQGLELIIEDSCVTQNAVMQLRKPKLAASMKKDRHYQIVGEVYDLAPASFKFSKPATLVLPVPDNVSSNAVRLGKWDMQNLEWVSLEGSQAANGRVSIQVTELGRFSVMEEAKPLGIHNIKFSPNPFSPHVAPLKILFDLTSDKTTAPVVTVKIYNMVGDLVKILLNGELLDTGAQVLEWDGITDHGKRALNGRYLVHFRIKDSSGEKEELKTMVLIK